MHSSSLEKTARVWQTWGRKDPLYAILSTKTGHSNIDDFFASGEEEVNAFINQCHQIGITLPGGTALDFGCGIGRLSRALAKHFDAVIGVDIAPAMIDLARQYNPGDKFRFIVNTAPDLRVIPDAAVNFVFSRIVLQHIPPEIVKQYVTEFYRILRPGGIMAIHMPSTPESFPPGFKTQLRRLIGTRAYKRLVFALLHRTSAVIDMNHIPEAEMVAHLTGLGARILAVEPILSNAVREHRQYIAAKQ